MNTFCTRKSVSTYLALSLFFSFPTRSQDNRGERIDSLPRQESAHFIFKEYDDVISDNTITQTGLFTVHKVRNKYYFELPDSILNKEILVASRISSIPHGFSAFGAGVYTKLSEHQVIRFQRMDDSILLRLVSYDDMSDPHLPITESVNINNFESIVYNFNIEAIGSNSSSYVIDVTDFFSSDIPLLGLHNAKYDISTVDKSRSIILSLKTFSGNVEVRHILTYSASKLPYGNRNNSLSFELNHSFVLLPEQPMTPRLFDDRFDYFSINRTNYGSDEHGTTNTQYIVRWRLEPKDWDAFDSGHLAEPTKPIVFYLDPATPIKWRPYIKQGVEDWGKAFEHIGFKNAIKVEDAPLPSENPDWDPNDFRFSMIRYVATERGTAVGFTVNDPRTGEILRADIHWGHNMMNTLRNYFFVQTAASNPQARCAKFNDKVMGELIRSAIAHEVGHTLGLTHVDDASSAYRVDSLRSPTFTSTNGNSPTIMDYAWGNYIAQPEDSVKDFYTQIGELDYLAIRYGYTPTRTSDSGREDQQIEESSYDRLVCFRKGLAGYMDLGDDPLIAAELGIKNLKRIRKNLIEWTTGDCGDSQTLKAIYKELFAQFERCLEPVCRLVGGIYYFPKATGEDGPLYRHISSRTQKDAIVFLNDHLFKTPTWLIDEGILEKISSKYSDVKILYLINRVQQNTLRNLFRSIPSAIQNEVLNTLNAYTAQELYEDLCTEIFSELDTNTPIDIYRRGLQRAMVEELAQHLNSQSEFHKNSDLSSIALGNLLLLKDKIHKSMAHRKDELSKYHLQELQIRIDSLISKQFGIQKISVKIR